MQKICNILSHTISILLHPLLMPTYGMGLYMSAMLIRTPALPVLYILTSIIATFIITAFIPIILLLILWKRGSISSLHIDNAVERTTPYVYTTICFGFWCYLIGAILRLPQVWLVIAIGATCAILAVTIINRWWKISAHLTAMGGFLGGLCSLALYYSTMPIISIIVILILSLLLMYARLFMNAHTPIQVVAGYVLGICFTFIPNLIIHHA